MHYNMYNLFNIVFLLIFLLFAVVFVVSLIRIVKSWTRNQKAPRLTVSATVVAKRTDAAVHRRNTVDETVPMARSMRYFVTVQVESGDRMEFQVEGRQYGLILEGDRGNLTFQGTRFLDFQRF